MSHFLTVSPRDPIIARDGRPFGATQGRRMKSLGWPYPSVLAGSLRTLLGKNIEPTFSADTVGALKEIEIAGPLPLVGNQLYFPAPKDFLLRDEPDRTSFAARPSPIDREAGEGCDLPESELLPVLLPETAGDDFKPGKVPAFWSARRMREWLLDPTGALFQAPPKDPNSASGFLDSPPKDERMHVVIEPQTGAAKEGLLYMTVGLALDQEDLLAARVECKMAARVECRSDSAFAAALCTLDAFYSFGGERRLARFKSHDLAKAWACPDDVQAALRESPRVRLVLATPALFKNGWKPAWLDHRLEGQPPGAGVTLKLVGACLDRWRPISGWSLETGRLGPKAVRRLAPAGSVYFFEVTDKADLSQLAQKLWLRSVCDDDQDQRDGFGLALWGVWDPFVKVHQGK